LIGSGVNYIQNIGGFGAGHLIDTNDRSVIERTNGIFKGKGADAVIVCASDKGALEMAIDLVASQGRIVVEGHYDPSVEITFSPFNLLVARSVVMRANRGWLTPDYVRALKLISDGMLDAKSLITHRFSLAQWEEAFETFSTNRGNAIQVAIEP
jgi:L-iditol 2-dehydrogenase